MNKNASIAVISSNMSRTGADESDTIATETDDDILVELIWKELNGRVDREQIRQAILKVKATYQDATVKTFVPIFIRREVLEMWQ